ncbi:hypothetical protein [Arthrobacter sp. DR-2P]|nr:hypothetical protein [Arthrobacter sp. DR-2P]
MTSLWAAVAGHRKGLATPEPLLRRHDFGTIQAPVPPR